MSSTRRIIARAILERCCSWRFWCKLCFNANLQIRSPLNSLAYIVPHCAKNGRLHQGRSGQEDAAGPPLEGPAAMLPPNPRSDLALRRACQRFGEAFGRFIELRRSSRVDSEDAEPSDATCLAAARSQWTHALSELSDLRATTWGGLQVRYEAWMRLEAEFGQSDGRVFELAVDLAWNTYALAWENNGDRTPSRHNTSDFTLARQPRSTLPALLSRVGGSLPLFALRGRRSQT
jgi:hypothetical protein